MRFEILLVLLICFSFVFAGGFEDIIDTANFVRGDFDCGDFSNFLVDNYSGYILPDSIPFDDEVFDVYVFFKNDSSSEFLISVNLENKRIVGFGCDENIEASYRFYVSDSLLESDFSGYEDDFADFYIKNKKSGNIRIEAVGFGDKIKLGLINFGIWVSSFFG